MIPWSLKTGWIRPFRGHSVLGLNKGRVNNRREYEDALNPAWKMSEALCVVPCNLCSSSHLARLAHALLQAPLWHHVHTSLPQLFSKFKEAQCTLFISTGLDHELMWIFCRKGECDKPPRWSLVKTWIAAFALVHMSLWTERWISGLNYHS